MYKLYGSLTSRSFRVMWMLEELGLDYEYDACGPRTEEIYALNPSGKVPVPENRGQSPQTPNPNARADSRCRLSSVKKVIFPKRSARNNAQARCHRSAPRT